VRNSFIFYSSYYDAISELPEDEQGLIYKAIIDYAIAKKEPHNLTPACRMCFKLIKPTIDAALSRYDASVENGKKGGAPKGNSNAQKQPKNNLETTQEQPRNNLETSEIQAKNNLDIDIDMDVDKDLDKDIDFELVNKNKFNIEFQETCARVRERTQKEREPYLKFYSDYFYEWLVDPWKSIGYEVVDTMIEAHEQATVFGLKFDHKIITGKEFVKIISNVDVEQFRSIATQIRFNEDIKNRPYYILGCIMFAASDKKNRMTQQQMNDFIKAMEGK
jgi:hypothetical protein